MLSGAGRYFLNYPSWTSDKTAVFEKKNKLNRIFIRLDIDKKKMSELKELTIESIQN